MKFNLAGCLLCQICFPSRNALSTRCAIPSLIYTPAIVDLFCHSPVYYYLQCAVHMRFIQFIAFIYCCHRHSNSNSHSVSINSNGTHSLTMVFTSQYDFIILGLFLMSKCFPSYKLSWFLLVLNFFWWHISISLSKASAASAVNQLSNCKTTIYLWILPAATIFFSFGINHNTIFISKMGFVFLCPGFYQSRIENNKKGYLFL